MKQKFIDCMMKFSHDAWGGDSIPSTEKSFAEVFDVLVKNGIVQQWQPIETAPKDGTEIDLFDINNSHKLQKTGIRSTSCKFINGKWCKFTIEPDGMARFIELPYALQNPTHWQPLPQPPKP